MRTSIRATSAAVAGVLVAAGLVTGAASAAPVNDPGYRSLPYSTMHIPEAWTWTTGAAGVTVAVVGTGVTAVRDLDDGRVLPGRDFVDDDDDATDTDGHGTRVAGIIAAQADNGYGIVGVCRSCRILPVRVLRSLSDLQSDGVDADIAAGIVWAADRGAQVIAVPVARTADSPALRSAVAHAAAAGSLVVASVGDERTGERTYPAGIDSVLAVSGVDSRGWWDSGVSGDPDDPWIDVAAVNALRVLPLTGTGILEVRSASISASVVAGAAGLVYALHPDATAAEVRDALVGTAQRLQPPPHPPVLHAARAVHRFAPADTVAPTVVATGLVAGELLGPGNTLMYPTVTDDHAVDRIELSVGGRTVSVDREAPWMLDLPSPPSNFEGDWPVTVHAVDYDGNVGWSTTVVRVDAVLPEFTAFGWDLVKGGVRVHIATDATDVASVQIGPVLIDAVQTPSPWIVTLTSAQVGRDGWFDISIQDRAGNRAVYHRHVDIDDRPPLSIITAPARGATVRGTFTSSIITTTDKSGIAKAALYVDGKLVGTDRSAPYRLSVDSGRKRGTMTLVWKVTDGVGYVFTATRTVTAKN